MLNVDAESVHSRLARAKPGSIVRISTDSTHSLMELVNFSELVRVASLYVISSLLRRTSTLTAWLSTRRTVRSISLSSTTDAMPSAWMCS